MISAIPANPSSGRWAIMDEEINCMSCSRGQCYHQRSKGMAWRNTKSEQWDTLHAEYWILCIVVQIPRPHSTDDNIHAKRGTPQFCMIISYCACTGLRYTIVWASIVWRFFLGFLMKSDCQSIDSVLEQMPGSVILQPIPRTYLLRKPVNTSFILLCNRWKASAQSMYLLLPKKKKKT